jgi:hypothetical protein
MVRLRRVVWMTALAVTLVCVPSVAFAQFVGGAKPRQGTVEFAGGGLWTAGKTLSSVPASLTPNPGGGESSFDLFDSEPRIGQAFGGQALLAVYLTPSLAIEGGFHYSRPTLEVKLSDDFEDAPDVTASTTINSYLFTGSLVYHFNAGGSTVPFIAGGVGHLRDAAAGNDVVETGVEYHGTVGVKSWFGRVRKWGWRAEAGISVRDGGFNFEDEVRIAPGAAFSLLYLF